MSYLQIGHQIWPYDTIEHLDNEELKSADHYQQATLKLARAWLKGEENFTLHTSGSTGHPKAIKVNRSQVQQSVKQTAKFFNLKSGEVLLNALSPDYVAGFMMIMRGLVWDMPVILLPPSRQPIPEWLLSYSPALTAFVPLQFLTIGKTSIQHLSFLGQIGSILIGGAPISHEVQDLALRIQANVYHTYGMTETLTHVAIRQISPESWEHFQAMQGNSFSQDEVGRLTIHTPIWQKPIQTNDRVQLIDQYHFRWLGRADLVINSGGYKIQTEAVEQTISELISQQGFPFTNCFLSSLQDHELGQKAILILEGQQADLEQFRDRLEACVKDSLPRYAVPKAIFCLPAFQHTHTGKLDRQASLDQLNLPDA